MESFSHSGKKMLYKEVQFDINYSRKNLRWDGWGAHGQDFFLKDHILHLFIKY
jgi:hypothetical protein